MIRFLWRQSAVPEKYNWKSFGIGTKKEEKKMQVNWTDARRECYFSKSENVWFKQKISCYRTLHGKCEKKMVYMNV